LDDIGHHDLKGSEESQSKTAYSEPREWRIPPIGRYLRPVLASLLVLGLLAGIVAGTGALISHLLNRGDSTTTASPQAPTSSQTYSLTVSVEHPERGTVSREPNDTNYKSGTVVQLTALPANGYVFDRWSGDANTTDSSGTTTIIMDSDRQLRAHFKIKDTTPPEISEIRVVKYSDTTATVAWKASESTTGFVKYKGDDTTSYIDSVPSATDELNNHLAKLTGLKPNSTYYYTIELVDLSGNQATSRSQLLYTLPPVKEGHEAGMRAPNLPLLPYQHCDKLPLSDGSLELAKLLGKKKLYINFWSTYCMPCVVEFPLIQTIHEQEEKRNPLDWTIITICIDGRQDRIEKLWDKYPELTGITLPILFYAEDADKGAYHVWKLPTNVFVDEDGIIRHVRLGRFHSTQEIRDILDSI